MRILAAYIGCVTVGVSWVAAGAATPGVPWSSAYLLALLVVWLLASLPPRLR